MAKKKDTLIEEAEKIQAELDELKKKKKTLDSSPKKPTKKDKTKPAKNDNDVHLVSQDKADIIQAQQRNVNNRATFNQAVDKEPGIPHANFDRFQFKSKNKSTNI